MSKRGLPVLNFFVTLAARWLGLACSLAGDARAAYAREGLRAALFELEVGARTAHALALGSPIIFGELLRATREAEGLRVARRAGWSVEAYVRRRCVEVGVPLGSETHTAVLVWATEIVNFWEREKDARGGEQPVEL
jgi:hypothetical protein